MSGKTIKNELPETNTSETNSQTTQRQLLISELGWSEEEAQETRMRLRSFEEDWNAPGMEGYDDL